MFGFFKKKNDSLKVIDKIWMTESAKWAGIMKLWKEQPEMIIICWFADSLRHLESLFAMETVSSVSLFMASEVHSPQLRGKTIIFAEHHPLRKTEQDKFFQWGLKQVIVHSALDEPLFLVFGGEKIMDLMKGLGMQEDSMIEHKMISNAIVNAQQKIENKVHNEHKAISQKEWMENNLHA